MRITPLAIVTASTTALAFACGASSLDNGDPKSPAGTGGSAGEATEHAIGSGGYPDHWNACPGAGAGLNCGGSTGQGYGGTLGAGGAVAPVGAGGRLADWDACSGAYAKGAFSCGGSTRGDFGGALATGSASGFAGSGYGGSGGTSETLTDVVSLRIAWASSADAGASLYDVTMATDGSATCRAYQDDWRMVNHTIEPDPEVQALLDKPGAVALLSTACTLNVADAGPTIVTTFASGRQVSHMVVSSCATDILIALSKAMRRIGEACLASEALRRDI